MKIIGIDQSLSCTAVSVKDLDGNYNVTDEKYFFTTTVKKHSYQHRIKPWLISNKAKGFTKTFYIVDYLSDIFKSVRGDAYLALEGYSFGSQSQSIFQLGELGGAIKYVAKKNDIKIRTYEPTVIKKFATGKGSGKKAPMYESYRNLFPDSNILKAYDIVNRKLPVEPQLSRSIGKPLCDLIDSDFIAHMLCEELRLKNGIESKYKRDEIFLSTTKNKKDCFAERSFE